MRHNLALTAVILLHAALLVFNPACAGEDAAPAPTPAITTASGLIYQDLKPGSGEPAAAGQTVAVQYTGWVAAEGKRGQRIGATQADGPPFVFRLGRGEVIKGWDEGVAGMRPGGVRRLTVPPALVGYGAVAGSPIPADATLIFEVELVEIRR